MDQALEGIIDEILDGQVYVENPAIISNATHRLRQLQLAAERLPIPVDIINKAVLTQVEGQGITDVTPLEAAIIVRWPTLVTRLLAMGADPNMSTSGESLVDQLRIAKRDELCNVSTCSRENIEIIDKIICALLNAGAYATPEPTPVNAPLAQPIPPFGAVASAQERPRDFDPFFNGYSHSYGAGDRNRDNIDVNVDVDVVDRD